MLASCSDNEKSSVLHIEDFSSSPHSLLKPSKRIELEGYGVLNPRMIVNMNNKYLVVNKANNDVFNLIDDDKRTIVKGINKGAGPNEIMYLTGIENSNDRIVVYDGMRTAAYTISISGDTFILSDIMDMSMEKGRVIFASFQNDAIAVSGYLPGCWAKYTSSDNHDFDIPYPEIELIKDLTEHERSALLMNTHVALSPDGKHMALSTSNGCMLGIVVKF